MNMNILLKRANNLTPHFIPTRQQHHRNARHQHHRQQYHRHTQPRADIRHAEKSVAKAVYHVEKRVEVGGFLPKIRQAVDGVKHARQKGCGHDDEVLKGGELVKFFRPYPREQTQRAQQRRAQK